MARIALKVDVDTLRGTREGVPKLLSMLEAAQAQATFLFSLGPDHTGWALRRVFRPGFLKKVSRTSVVSNYGLRTLMYGVLDSAVLWNTKDLGYLTIHVAAALAKGTAIAGTTQFPAGRLGTLEVKGDNVVRLTGRKKH